MKAAAKNGMLDAQRKEIAFRAIKEALAIAQVVYEIDKRRYKPLFAWINKMIAVRRSPVLLLQAMQRLKQTETSGRPVRDIVEYAAGTLRKLEREREAKRLRAGTGPSLLGDILDRAARSTREK